MENTSEPTVRDIYVSMTDEEQACVEYLVGAAMDSIIDNIDDVIELRQMILAAVDNKPTRTSSILFRNLIRMCIYASTIKKHPATVLQRAITTPGIGRKQCEILTKMVNPYITHINEKED